MASIIIKGIGSSIVHFRDPSTQFDLVEVISVDPRGRSCRAKFIRQELLDALKRAGGDKIVVESVSTKADAVDLVR